jgi:YidC/Oxa1 family membrane protein insertase
VLAAGSPLDPLYDVIGWLLAFFYQPFASLGLAIILLTMTVMLVQFPLIAKQTRSMIQMQRVQPEIKRIQQKHKDDRQKQNEELLKFYQENKINPLAGCLPLLLIMPIGIAVFRTFSLGVQRHIPQTGPFNRLYSDLCGDRTVSQCTDYLKTNNPKTLYFLGMNLNWSAREVQSELAGHVIQWLPYFLLIALVMLTGWYQVRQTQARQLRQGGAPPNPQMVMITRIMPIFFGLITYTLNAATTLYFVVSNLWRIGQQKLVLNKMYEEAVASGEIKPAGGGKGSGAKAGGDKSPPAKSPPGKAVPGGKDTDGTGPDNKSRDGTGNGRGSSTGPRGASGANGGPAKSTPSPAARRRKKRKR